MNKKQIETLAESQLKKCLKIRQKWLNGQTDSEAGEWYGSLTENIEKLKKILTDYNHRRDK